MTQTEFFFLVSGTDATIAEHIAKIIEREYVVEKQEARTKYLVPSTLGIGLVDGYNQIGFDRSLTKPHLRREVSWGVKAPCRPVLLLSTRMQDRTQDAAHLRWS